MNDNLIRYIIQEEIEKLLNEDLGEARRLVDPAEMWANMEGGTTKKKRKIAGTPPTPRPRQKVTSFYDARTPNQIGKTIRSAWDDVKLRAITGFNKNAVGMYGIKNSDAMWAFFNDNGRDMFTAFQVKYHEIEKLTGDIQAWGREGDMNSVTYRLRDLPKPLEELADTVTKLYEKCQQLKKLTRMNDVPLPGGMKPSIINGYMTSNGLAGLIVYNGRQKHIGEITGKLRECAEYIRSK